MTSIFKVVRPFLSSRSAIYSSSRYYTSLLEDSFYNEEEKDLQLKLRKIIEKDINPFVDEWEAAEKYPGHSIMKLLGDANLLGINRPKEFGGLGRSYKTQAAFLEECGTINCTGVPGSIAVQTVSTFSLALFGSNELKEQFLKPALKGEMIGCNGVSEPKGAEKTTAKRNGDDLIINGEKMWGTNGMQADYMILMAETSFNPEKKRGKKTLICVPLNLQGITRKKLRMTCMKSSDTAHIKFDNVKVPSSYIIGEEGEGFRYLYAQYQEVRLAEGVLLSLKALDNAIKITIEKTRSSADDKKPILDNQTVHFRLAELATEVEVLRALVYKCVELYDNDQDINLLASMAKVKAGRLMREVSDACIQFWGASGFLEDAQIARIYRDFRLGSIAGGSDELMLTNICRSMDILPKVKKEIKSQMRA